MRKNKFKLAWGRMHYYGKAKNMIDELERKLQSSQIDDERRYYIMGMIGGISDGQNLTHKKTIDLFINVKKEIVELDEDFELFKYEIEYKKGYNKGLQQILDANREYFKLDMPILFVSYFEDVTLLRKYEAAIQFTDFKEYDAENIYKEMFFFSDEVKDIIKIVTDNKSKNIELSIMVVANDRKSPILDQLNRISEVKPENIFIVFDNNEINVRQMIDKIVNYHVVG